MALLFALNPNMLYLQSTPMTELLFAASLAALLWATLWFRDSQSVLGAARSAAAASNAASLTRYEGWFLIPFVALYFLLIAKRKWHAVLFGALAALGPAGVARAQSLLLRQRARILQRPVVRDGDLSPLARARDEALSRRSRLARALHYYFAAARLVAGWPADRIGAAGAIVRAVRARFWPLLLLALPPAFYVWSMHSSGTPIFVPDLWPHSWYNTRYAIALLLWPPSPPGRWSRSCRGACGLPAAILIAAIRR